MRQNSIETLKTTVQKKMHFYLINSTLQSVQVTIVYKIHSIDTHHRIGTYWTGLDLYGHTKNNSWNKLDSNPKYP